MQVFFFVFAIIALQLVLKAQRLPIIAHLSVSLFVFIILTISSGIIAQLFGARQASVYVFQMTDVSGMGFIYWLVIFGLFLSQGKSFFFRHANTIAVSITLFYLVSYFLIEVTARVFESGLPLVLMTGLELTGWRRVIFISSYLLFALLQWTLQGGMSSFLA